MHTKVSTINSSETNRVLKMAHVSFFAALFLLCVGSVQAQDSLQPDTVRAFARTPLRLLDQKVAPQDFSLPLALPPAPPRMGNLSLSSLKGKVVFLNFWATWCGPCRDEMPSMEALYGSFKNKGLEILAVNLRESPKAALDFMRNNRLSFPTVLDTDGRVSGAYGIQAIPTSFLIDRDGQIIAKLVGSIDWDTPEIYAAFESLLR